MPDISYNVIKRPRRKTACIVIRPGNDIDVLVPPYMTARQIERLVHDKAGWIHKKLHFNEHVRARPQPRKFREGETLIFAGAPLQLSIRPGRHAVRAEDETILVHLPRHDPLKYEEIVRRKLTGWYRKQALEHLEERVAHYSAIIGQAPTKVGVKSYKSRWGSCHRDGRIYFNWRIVMAPEPVIDYVVVHELCHLIHHNHAPAYWQLVESVLPEFRQAKTWLKINSLTLEL